MNVRFRKERGTWRVDFGVVNGRRRSQDFPTKKKAEEAMALARRVRERHGTAGLALAAGELAEVLRAKARLEASGATMAEAVDFFLTHAGVASVRVTLDDGLERYLLAKQAGGVRATYLSRLETTLGSFIRGREKLLMCDVTVAEVRAWFAGRGWAARTVRGYLEDLRAWFAWARGERLMHADPTAGMTVAMPEPVEVEVLTVAECEKLLTKCATGLDAVTGRPFAAVLGYVTLALFCGIRRAELHRLTVDSVDEEQSLVIIAGRQAKTRARRTVTLAPNALLWWRWWRAWGGEEIICVNWHDLFARLTKIVRTPWPRNALRHSFASYHYALHRNELLTQAEMGHESAAMLFAHYRGLVKPADAAAFWALRPPADVAQ